MRIMNLTQHLATPDQIAAGVFDLVPEARAELTRLLTFDTCPTRHEVAVRASKIAGLAARYTDKYEAEGVERAEAAMIGGAPYLMSHLERLLNTAHNAAHDAGWPVRPRAVYAFSERVSSDEVQPDGSVVKRSAFKHAGFVETIQDVRPPAPHKSQRLPCPNRGTGCEGDLDPREGECSVCGGHRVEG